jgi:hypothetical protein
MFGRIAAAIARVLATMGKDFWSSLPGIGRTIDSVIEWPFRVLFGGASPLPHYEPTITKSGVIDDFKQARRAAASLHTIDPFGIDTVRRYCNAKSQTIRDTLDLSAIRDDARVLLLTMGDDELAALGKAGPGQLKKFVDGKRHGVDGVPIVGVHAPIPANDRSPRPSLDHRRWKTEALLKRDVENRLKLG